MSVPKSLKEGGCAMRFDTLFRYRKQCMAAASVLILLNHMKAFWPENPAKIAASFFYLQGLLQPSLQQPFIYTAFGADCQ